MDGRAMWTIYSAGCQDPFHPQFLLILMLPDAYLSISDIKMGCEMDYLPALDYHK